jgi:DNA-binding beta-propeller fold protein YncE
MTLAARTARPSTLVIACSLLVSCGGAGGGGGTSPGGGSSPPSITQPPLSQTAKPGASVTFTGAATGSPAPTYQWERSTDQATWTAITGATSTTYTLTAQMSDNRAWFRFKARSNGQEATSGSAQLTVTTVSAVWRIGGWGLALDTRGSIYVADWTGNQVVKLSSAGAVLTQWGSPGSGAGQFNTPKFISTDATDAVYVADTGNCRIQKFDSSGTFQRQWGTRGESTAGAPAPDGTFNGPTGIAVDAARGSVFVVDSNNNRVQKFDLSGTFLAKWGDTGTGNGQFRFIGTGQGPEGGIAVDASGDVYVVDNMNWRVQKFSGDGTYVTLFGGQGTGGGQFLYPSGIAVDSARGFVYVVDNTTNGNLPGNVCKVAQFDLSGTYLSSWQAMSLDGTPESAIGVATDAAGSVYLTQGASIGKYLP